MGRRVGAGSPRASCWHARTATGSLPGRTYRHRHAQTHSDMLRGPASPVGSLTWHVVDIAPIHQRVPILGVAEWGQVGTVGGTGPDVAPHTACRDGVRG